MSGAVLVTALVAFGCTDDVTAPVTQWESVLIGANEVPAIPGTGAGTGTFALNATGDTLVYSLVITSATGTAVTQSHIHTGAAGATGGVSVWLCGTATNPGPAGTPACIAGVGLATGTLISGRVAVSATVINSMRAFGTYANVHTTTNTGGEIRGQLRIVPS